MTQTFKIKKGDTKPYLATTLNSTDGTAINLSSGSVWFIMATNDGNYTTQFSGACVITGSVEGQCEYRWGATNTGSIGNYLGEFEVVYNDGTKLTIPADDSFNVKIGQDYS